MIRAAAIPFVTPVLPTVPGWAVPQGSITSDSEAAFMAGAALNSLDGLVRADPAWAGAWRQRLALKCAVASVRLAGRNESEAALRDAALLTRPDDDPGPAGNVLAAWGRLASRSARVDVEALRVVVDLHGLAWSQDLEGFPSQIDALVRAPTPAPFSAAMIAIQVFAVRPDAEQLAWWLADLVLSQKLRWSRCVPLLTAQVFTPALHAGSSRLRPGAGGFDRAVCIAVAQGAAEACRIAGEIARRAERLAAVAPSLRAKGAGEAIVKLLCEDAVSGSLVTPRLSRFGSRRLFERLMDANAVRELSGRTTFRLYGL
ncbi:DUF1403 family protein [Mesorhizobium sp. M0621]